MKYFFLSEDWGIGKIWANEGLWEMVSWRRKPDIEKTNICIVHEEEILWLHKAEESILMVEVKPNEDTLINDSSLSIRNVVLKRLMNAEEVLQKLAKAGSKCYLKDIQLLA